MNPPPLPTTRRWFQGMLVPTVLMWSCAFVAALVPLVADADTRSLPASEYLLRVALAVAISNWVTADARLRRRRLPYDYDSFLFFAWPVLGPVYLWQTRRWRALITLGWFALLLIVASTGDLMRLVRSI